MAPASLDQIRLWQAKIDAHPRLEMSWSDEVQLPLSERHEYKALGWEDWLAWSTWRFDESRKTVDKHFREISPQEFVQAFKALKCDSDTSIGDFADLLGHPNTAPIHIGYIKDLGDLKGENHTTRIMLGPDPGQLDVHPYPDNYEPAEKDARRVLFAPTVLGLWETPSHFRQGSHFDEALFEYEPKSRKTPSEPTHGPVRLEVFQQLGLLYYKKFKRGEEVKTEGEESKYRASNYVLVSNIYDDSICVIWNSRPMNQETGDRDPTKDDPHFQLNNYALFPGTECDTAETIIYAKIAESWDSLGFDKAISFSQVRRRTQNGQIVPESVLVYVHWTSDGGLRRENDFRSMEARRSGDS